MALSYRDAGVDIDAGDAFVKRIAPMAEATKGPEVLGGVGGFAGLFRLPEGMERPVLVAGSDGVGTKLKLAQEARKLDTVGIDLVAMCVNDVITTGARPLFFLDYLATGKLEVEHAASLVEGIAAGCKQARCALLGGETAELPGMMAQGSYELAGFAVGAVDEAKILRGDKVRAGDAIVALPSSGLHANGYSLARKVFLELGELDLQSALPGTTASLISSLLEPTRIYVDAVERALKSAELRAMAHITGGGLPENMPRVLPNGLGAYIDTQSWSPPAVFAHLERLGGVDKREMFRTFNMGIGYAMVVPKEQAPSLCNTLTDADAFVCGEIVETQDGATRVELGP